MPKRRDYTDLIAVLRTKDLWMMKAIYLVFLLRKLDIDVDWLLHCKDKQAIYDGIERLGVKPVDNEARLIEWVKKQSLFSLQDAALSDNVLKDRLNKLYKVNPQIFPKELSKEDVTQLSEAFERLEVKPVDDKGHLPGLLGAIEK